MALNTIKQWMRVNKLKMNARKTKYMIIRSVRKEREVMSFSDAPMKFRLNGTMKYLDTVINDKLNLKISV